LKTFEENTVKQGHTERFERERACTAHRPRTRALAALGVRAARTFPRPPHAPRRLEVSLPRAAPDRPVRPLFPLLCAPTEVAVVLRSGFDGVLASKHETAPLFKATALTLARARRTPVPGSVTGPPWPPPLDNLLCPPSELPYPSGTSSSPYWSSPLALSRSRTFTSPEASSQCHTPTGAAEGHRRQRLHPDQTPKLNLGSPWTTPRPFPADPAAGARQNRAARTGQDLSRGLSAKPHLKW
jgi:hypothetical protein